MCIGVLDKNSNNFSCKKKDFCFEKKILARGKKHRLNGWFLNQKAPGLE
jgi:hypothetical protein